MPQFGGKNAKKKSSSSTKRHFTVVIGSKEHGLYVSSSPSSAARKAVSKLCATDKKRKVQFSIREITQGSKKKTYGPYLGEIEKLEKPIELKGRVIRYKPVAKLSGKTGAKKGRIMKGGGEPIVRIKYDLEPDNSNNPFDKKIKELLELDKSNIFQVTISGGNVVNQYVIVRFKRDYRESMDDGNFGKEIEKLKNVLIDINTEPIQVQNLGFEFPEHKQQPDPKEYGLKNNNRQMDNNSITHYNNFLTELKKLIES